MPTLSRAQLQRIEHLLSQEIGPMARVLIRRQLEVDLDAGALVQGLAGRVKEEGVGN